MKTISRIAENYAENPDTIKGGEEANELRKV
jgi:hypothetical protein